MIDNIEAISVFKPNKQESKAQITDAAARAIIDSEAARREAKTARLREARLAMEAAAPSGEETPKKTRKSVRATKTAA